MAKLSSQLETWAGGIGYEVSFWRDWFATKGGQWPEDYLRRMDPKKPLDPLVRNKLLGLSDKVKILDVGAGPISSVGYQDPDLVFELVPVDPLAPIYQRLYAEFDAIPPVPTVFAPAEDLSSIFIDHQFDLVHCRNALDHSFDPIRAIEEMLRVVRIRGYIVLVHHQNEAEREDYDGFHQYNMDVIDGRFVVWNKVERHTPENIFQNYAAFNQRLENGFVIVEIEKISEFPDTASYQREAERLASVWEAVIHALSHKALN